MKNIAIFGAGGAIGHSLAAELDRRGMQYRTVGRHREQLAAAFPRSDAVAADLADPEAAEWAASGVDTIFYTVGVPYPQFKMHPVLARNAVNAAAKAGVTRFVLVSSVYSYGRPQTARVAESHPRTPGTKKGEFRRQQEDLVMNAHQEARIQGTVVHLPDFYGPHAELSFAQTLFEPAKKGATANWLGDPGLPHEFVYVPDAGPVLLDLAAREDAYGQRWNLGGPGTITGREFVTQIYEAAGHKPKLRAVPKIMLRALGLFNPLMRELVELSYLWETPVILDDSKLQSVCSAAFTRPRTKRGSVTRYDIFAPMSDPQATPPRHRPYVPENMKMSEFTVRAVLLGLVMTVILGAANAYLGLRAGMTIAATYPAAVIGMAVLRLLQGIDSGREHRANGGIDRRVGGGGRDLHDAGVRHRGGVARLRHARRRTGNRPR